MKSVLLIGLGRFGRHMAAKLNEMNHEVLAIDIDEQRVNDVLPVVTSAQIGDSTNENFVASLGVRNFDLCVVAIGDNFQSSLETVALLKDYGAPFVVARANRDVHAKFLLRNGADEVVYPEKEMAIRSAVKYSSDNVFDYIELTGDYSIYESTHSKCVDRQNDYRFGCTYPIPYQHYGTAPRFGITSAAASRPYFPRAMKPC